ncbi:MerR family transcriptional regulator [Photorhabdus asymbiotica]|uniref:MerR family transcriptional regulator n=1 Tax=Photorhabdus asymbiotica TaxID=291112 RepID=UPI003DA75E34
MRIKEFSKKSGVSARMLRYYEEQGLLNPGRTSAGYRKFTSLDLVIIRNIKSLQQIGLTLDTIRVLMPCILDEPVKQAPCPLMLDILRKQREKIKEELGKNFQALLLLDKYLS